VLNALEQAKLDRKETYKFVTVVETLSDYEAGVTAQVTDTSTLYNSSII
jgi:hypothetical protein